MIVLHLPFDIEHPAVKAGVESGKQAIYQQDKPKKDIDFVGLIKDFCEEEVTALAYNVGFLIGLYIAENGDTQPQQAIADKEEGEGQKPS